MPNTTLVVPAAGDDAHALLSASSASRWGVCPVSLTGQKTRRSSRAAAEGTLAHYIADNILTGLPAPAEGTPATCEGHDYVVDEGFLRDVAAYTEYVRSRPWVGGYNTEVYANYSRALGVPHNLAWGTSDCSGFEQNPVAPRGVMLHVIDLKFGRNAVSPDKNEQMACYAGGVLDGLHPYVILPPDTWVQLTIFQPRLSHRPFSWLTTVGWIESMMQRLRPAAAAGVAYQQANDPQALAQAQQQFPEHPGAHCQYCPRQTACTAFNTVAATVGSAQTVEWNPTVFAMRKAITEYVESLEDLALQSALGGNVLPGTKLVQGRAGNPALKLPEDQLKQVVTQYGVLDRVYRSVPTWESPAKIRDALKAVNCPADVLATVVQAGAKKPAIADAGDPREAYAPPGLEHFTAAVRPA